MSAKAKLRVVTGVPIPGRDNSKWPFKKMLVGDSFFAPGEEGKRARAASYQFSRRSGGSVGFLSRRSEGGYRIWRTR